MADSKMLYPRFLTRQPTLNIKRLSRFTHRDYVTRLPLVAFILHRAWRNIGLGRRSLPNLSARSGSV